MSLALLPAGSAPTWWCVRRLHGSNAPRSGMGRCGAAALLERLGRHLSTSSNAAASPGLGGVAVLTK